MFSGIVEECAEVIELKEAHPASRLVIRSGLDHEETCLGDSIAISGVCLTVVENKNGLLSFELASETLRRTTLGELARGSPVNLERSLRVNSRLHGHFVFGHVDSVISLLARERDGECDKLVWELPAPLRGFIAPKGSISISGVSLTVGEVLEDRFSVYIIPHTAHLTTLGTLKAGASANVEIDMLARYVHSLLSCTGQGASHGKGSISYSFLTEHGYVRG